MLYLGFCKQTRALIQKAKERIQLCVSLSQAHNNVCMRVVNNNIMAVWYWGVLLCDKVKTEGDRKSLTCHCEGIIIAMCLVVILLITVKCK